MRDYRHPFYSDTLIRLVSQDFVVENFGLIDFGINTLHSPFCIICHPRVRGFVDVLSCLCSVLTRHIGPATEGW